MQQLMAAAGAGGPTAMCRALRLRGTTYEVATTEGSCAADLSDGGPALTPRLEELRGRSLVAGKLLRSAVVLLVALSGCFLVAVLAPRSALRQREARPKVSPAIQDIAQDTAVEEAAPQPAGPSPTLFCWSHLEPTTEDLQLLRLQLALRANIFSCNFAAVISTEKLLLGNIDGIEVWTWYNPAREAEELAPAPATEWAEWAPPRQTLDEGSPADVLLNTKIFMFAWDTLLHSQQLWPYDFVVKVDPNAVFFPHRLRDHVRPHVGQKVYFSNCGKDDGETLLYGSVEVFSVPAIRIYQDHLKDCKSLPWHGWGEDYFMQHCMDALAAEHGIRNIFDQHQVGDHRCVAAECWDTRKVAFHSYEDSSAWYDCFQTASESQ